MDRPRVINLRYDRPPAEDYVYIGRPSEWGNQFVIGRDGDRDEVVRKYEEILRIKVRFDKKGKLRAAIRGLRGKTLGCFCAPARCHGDVLVDWAMRMR